MHMAKNIYCGGFFCFIYCFLFYFVGFIFVCVTLCVFQPFVLSSLPCDCPWLASPVPDYPPVCLFSLSVCIWSLPFCQTHTKYWLSVFEKSALHLDTKTWHIICTRFCAKTNIWTLYMSIFYRLPENIRGLDSYYSVKLHHQWQHFHYYKRKELFFVFVTDVHKVSIKWDLWRARWEIGCNSSSKKEREEVEIQSIVYLYFTWVSLWLLLSTSEHKYLNFLLLTFFKTSSLI